LNSNTDCYRNEAIRYGDIYCTKFRLTEAWYALYVLYTVGG